VDRFITIGGEPFLIRYNSKLPIVVYAPEGVEVWYRIWSGAPEIKVLDEG
jgi:ecotin